MFDSDQYELIDFGHGEKLERFSGVVVRRPCPAAAVARPALSTVWRGNELHYSKGAKRWIRQRELPDPWILNRQLFQLELKPTPFGHLGVFCEQDENWSWIQEYQSRLVGRTAINLFAYTGGTTLALASCGAQVVHLDAAKNVVSWARKNAAISGLANNNIRWIVDDAIKFIDREIKRGKRYDFIAFDPPAVGHFGNKMTWNFSESIESLFFKLGQLKSDDFCGLLVTSHSKGYDGRDLKELSIKYFSLDATGDSECGPLEIEASTGRNLNCGYFFRYRDG